MLCDPSMKRVIAFVLPLLMLGIGCKGPRSVQLTAVAPKTLIKRAVLSDLGVWPVQPYSSDSRLGAIFVRVEPDELKYFTALYRGYSPRVDVSDDENGQFANMLMEDGGITDTITKLPGVMFAFQKIDIVDNEAEVEAIQSLGLLGVTMHTYRLALKNNKWVTRSHSVQAIADQSSSTVSLGELR